MVEALIQVATPKLRLNCKLALPGVVAFSPSASNSTALPPFGRAEHVVAEPRVAVIPDPEESASAVVVAEQSFIFQNPLAVTNSLSTTPSRSPGSVAPHPNKNAIIPAHEYFL